MIKRGAWKELLILDDVEIVAFLLFFLSFFPAFSQQK